MKKTNEFMNKYDKIEVIANDFGNEDYDFCSVVFYKDKEKKNEAFFPVSLRSPEMPQLLKILHETYGVMPDFDIKKVEEETTTTEAEYGCPEWIENLFKDTDWNVKITETDNCLEYFFETWSDDDEDLVIEGEADTWEEIVEVIKYEYENADSDDTYDLFWEMRGKNGYPSNRDGIEEAIKSRKESFKELYDVVK